MFKQRLIMGIHDHWLGSLVPLIDRAAIKHSCGRQNRRQMTKVSQKVSQHEDEEGLSEGLSAHRTSSALLSHLRVTAASWSGREAMAQCHVCRCMEDAILTPSAAAAAAVAADSRCGSTTTTYTAQALLMRRQTASAEVMHALFFVCESQ